MRSTATYNSAYSPTNNLPKWPYRVYVSKLDPTHSSGIPNCKSSICNVQTFLYPTKGAGYRGQGQGRYDS